MHDTTFSRKITNCNAINWFVWLVVHVLFILFRRETLYVFVTILRLFFLFVFLSKHFNKKL